MNTKNPQHFGSTVEDAKITLERALREWKQQELVAKNQIDSIQKALAALGAGLEVQQLVNGSALLQDAEPVVHQAAANLKPSAAPIKQDAPDAPAKKRNAPQSLPETGGDWFPSLLSRKKYAFKFEIVDAMLRKAAEDMGVEPTDIDPALVKKLKDRLSFYLNNGVNMGTVKSTGSKADRRFIKI
jgi:hypothetical protein